jgi:arylsulfatase A-like enzyme/Tfp pilus assembly protein PilF
MKCGAESIDSRPISATIGLWIFAAALLAVGLAACSPSGPPSVLVVTFDTTRYDRIGPSGDASARTPTLDALAAEGLVFDRAYSPAPITLPAHTTIFTGFEPIEHGVHNNGRFVVPEEMETLAEFLSVAGYDTAAFVSAFVLDSKFNLDQGFDVYSDETRRRSSSPFDLAVSQRPADEVSDEAIAWLDALERDRPYLLWAHYYDPHFPRDVRDPFSGMFDAYAAEIAFADANFARLLAAAREASGERELFIVFTADHGESLGEHGEPTHAVLAYDSTLHVPLILVGPGVPVAERSNTFVRHADILPTLLEAVGIAVPGDLPGRSLLAAHRDGDPQQDASVSSYFESANPRYEYGWAEIQGIRTSRWKYTARPEPAELYDVLEDPQEQRNLIDAELEVRERMAALDAERHANAIHFGTGEHSAPILDADEREQLAALGYIEAPGEFDEGAEPDPRRWVRALNLINSARSLARAGNHARAITILSPLARSPMLEPLAIRELAPIYRDLGQLDKAVEAYQRHLTLTGSTTSRNALAETLLRAGRPEDALEVTAIGQDLSGRARWLRARALTALGRHPEARQEVERFPGIDANPILPLRSRAMLALQVAPIPDGEEELRGLLARAPASSLMESYLGFYLALWGRPDQRDEARQRLEKAAESAPDDAEIQSNLGWASYRMGHHDEAAEALDRAVTLDPERFLDSVRLAQVLAELGEFETALGMLRKSIAAQPAAQWAENARELAGSIRAEITRRDVSGSGA